jgi:prepilin-type N-terminal cleavage/methylation domain-containing protein
MNGRTPSDRPGLDAGEACCVVRDACSGSSARITHHASRAVSPGGLRLQPGSPRRAFTLIELMIVIAIMAIVMTMSAPAIYHIWHKESLRKSVADIVEACSHARSLAIMRGSMAELVFHAQDGSFEVAGAAPSHPDADPTAPMQVSAPGPNSGLSGKFPESVGIAVLKINGVNCMDAEHASVRFYPNGTCDELRLILLQPQDGEMRGIYLEITTSLASVESDRFKLASELR